MSNNIADDLKKLAMAGLGAAALVTEKSMAWIDELSKKGEETSQNAQPIIDDLAKKGADAFEKGKVIGSDLKDKLTRAFTDCADQMQQMDVNEVKDSMEGMTDDTLSELKAHLESVMDLRKSQSDEAQETPEE